MINLTQKAIHCIIEVVKCNLHAILKGNESSQNCGKLYIS